VRKIFEFRPEAVVLHFNKGDSQRSIVDALGEPEGTTDRRHQPVTYKYGNVYFTVIEDRVAGIGIDLAANADPSPSNIDLSNIEDIRGLSMKEVSDYFSGKHLDVAMVREGQLVLKQNPSFFISFDEEGVVDRIGIRSY